jgi:quercetin dioxygenase-like cupin family protein
MNKDKRDSLDLRKIEAPLLKFSIEKETNKLKNEPTWSENDRNSITLQKNSRLRVVLISMHKGADLREHTLEGPITLYVVAGKINFTAEVDSVELKTNELVVLERTIPHNVEALEDTTFILTIIQPQNN